MSPRRPGSEGYGPRPGSVVVCLLLVTVSAAPVASGRVPAVDLAVRSWAEAHQERHVFEVLDAVTRLAHWPWVCLLLVVVSGALAIARRTVQPLRQALLSVLLLVVVTWVLKAALGRPGPTGVPPWPLDGAWPSGHALAVVVAIVVVLRLFPATGELRRLVSFLPAVLVGVALVYCGHHWFTDVAVSLPLGLLIAWASDRLGYRGLADGSGRSGRLRRETSRAAEEPHSEDQVGPGAAHSDLVRPHQGQRGNPRKSRVESPPCWRGRASGG